MKGNFHVQFLGEGVAATSPPYPTLGGQPPRSTRPGLRDTIVPGPWPVASQALRLRSVDSFFGTERCLTCRLRAGASAWVLPDLTVRLPE